MKSIPLWRRSIYLFFAPLFIFVWMIFHPKLVWAQAKKGWNDTSACTGDCNQGRNCNCEKQ
jgi:hypothetical protein